MIRIAVTSLRGGAGVTALVSGMAQAAAAEGLDVTCVDADDQGLLKHHLGLASLSDDGENRSANARITLRTGQDWNVVNGADLAIFDLPRARPGLRDDVMADADAVVLVMPASASGLALAPSVKAFLSAGENRFVLINFADSRVALKTAAASYLQEQFGDRVIGQVRLDESVDEALAALDTLSSTSPYSAAWTDIRVAFVSLINKMNSLPVAAVMAK